jgi:predicted ATPase/class 3 adenylate cyclase
MQQIGDWLENLGMSEYAQRFAENRIDFSVLRELTDQDLKDLGVVLGDRRKMLRAIADIEGLEKNAPAAPAKATAAQSRTFVASEPIPTATPPPRAAAAEVSAERRQVTVMFSDLVGSTALSARMDPEDLREIISAYQKCIADTVQRFGGFVAKYMGDGVLVYFGYPEAHEDDAERAVRAGLKLIQAVAGLKLSAPLQTRVGIATGLVVVGDLIGSGAAREQTVVGETPNLAARLQDIAMPDTIVILESTRQLLGNLFDLQDLGAKNLKGVGRPVRAWAALRPSSVESRFEALRGGGLTTLVGREEELGLLLRRWSKAKTGAGQVVLLSGEPGIGKSRIIAALSESIGTEPHTRLRYFCSPQHQDSALFPFIAQLEHAAGFVHDDVVEAKLVKLRALLAPGIQDDNDIALLTELLSLPSAGVDLSLSPQRKRETLLEALLKQLEGEARRQPVLIVFEDAHWIDPTSRELLDLMVDRVRRLPALLAITLRPEFQPPWSGRSHVTTLTLNRLDESTSETLVQNLAGNAALNADTVAEIIARTDGVPLYVEELTKAVLESIEKGDRVAAVLATKSLDALSVPATLHASLMARLDRLGPAPKELAQIGAVLGREFAYRLIAPVAQRDERELQSALDQLSDAGLLFCRGSAPHSSYLFKHALVQDAAYGTLLRGRRQELHTQVAKVLEQDFADLVERRPELLAHHLTAAGEIERAVDQWLAAGQHAAARLAHLEAIRHFERGLAELAALPESSPRDKREIELQLARGLSLLTAKGFTAVEAEQAYTRARELAERQGDQRQLFTAVFGLWQSAHSGRIFERRRLSNRLQQLTAEKADDELRLQAHHSAWGTLFYAGEPAATREHCEAGRRLYDPERHRLHRQLYGGHDPGVCARMAGSTAEWLLGYPEQGLALGNDALALAEQIAHPFSLALALQFHSMLHLNRGEPELALQRLETAEALVAEQRLSFVIEPQLLRGDALTAQGAFEEAVACLHNGLASPIGTLWPCYGLAKLADVLTRQGDHCAALSAARDGLNSAEKTGQRHWDAELKRLEGVALSALNRLEAGERALAEAIGIAQTQKAKAFELRAAMSMVRLWRDQGKRDEARELLAPVYGWFTEGFDTLDLKQAKALLDELA